MTCLTLKSTVVGIGIHFTSTGPGLDTATNGYTQGVAHNVFAFFDTVTATFSLFNSPFSHSHAQCFLHSHTYRMQSFTMTHKDSPSTGNRSHVLQRKRRRGSAQRLGEKNLEAHQGFVLS